MAVWKFISMESVVGTQRVKETLASSLSNSSLIISQNSELHYKKRIPIHKGWVEFICDSEQLDFGCIRKLLGFISELHNRYRQMGMSLSLRFKEMYSVDKLTIQILECIVYSLIVDYHYNISLQMSFSSQIHTESFNYTPLSHLSSNKYSITAFIKAFEMDTRVTHYRRIVPKEWSEDGRLGSVIYSDIAQTIRNSVDDDEYINKMTEVITELINNANEHNDSDCLIDVDISGDYKKTTDLQGRYKGINVSVISFSRRIVPDLLKEKIYNMKFPKERYSVVARAFSSHKSFFGEVYTEDDFFTIASFQNKISGREADYSSGGTGLTKLIQSLEDYSDSSTCYMVSGKRALYFLQDYLDIDKEGWIGFNHENNFRDYPPDQHVVSQSPIYIPGVAYNLTFVYKKE
ncbi:MAG: hypothetical protein II889_01270 [Clostridia bacterium]|nr:hypothetical protein [Clostridia bacterium]